MNRKQKDYRAPEVQVHTVALQSIICQSPNNGINAMIVSGTIDGDSDFE